MMDEDSSHPQRVSDIPAMLYNVTQSEKKPKLKTWCARVPHIHRKTLKPEDQVFLHTSHAVEMHRMLKTQYSDVDFQHFGHGIQT